MLRAPRRLSSTFLSARQLRTSITQGLMITAGCLGLGYYFMRHHLSEATVRTSIFISLLLCNIFLTLINRSFHKSLFKTLKYKNYLIPLITGITFLFILCLLFIPFIRNLFKLSTLPFSYLISCIIMALISTLWVEVFKVIKR